MKKVVSNLSSGSFEESFFNLHGTFVHPSSIVGKDVFLEENVKIGPFCTISGKTHIASGSRLHGYASIGMPAQDIHTLKPLGEVRIGKNCEIREFVTIGAPKTENSQTIIGDNCYIMNFSHVAHDVTLEHNVVLINNVNLAGHVHVEHHVMLMANTGIHQFCKIGAYSALAPFSGMRQDLPPFCLFNGAPGKFAGLNLIALKRANFSKDDLQHLKTITKMFFQDKLPSQEIEQIIKQKEALANNVYVQQFLTFVKNSTRGITRKTIGDVS